jgi:hypothetical protein
MTVDHPKWNAFAGRLEGPEGCAFRKNAEGKITWTCTSTIERELATKILKSMKFDVESSLEYFAKHGGYCDCEILFNVERSAKRVDKRPVRQRARKQPKRVATKTSRKKSKPRTK